MVDDDPANAHTMPGGTATPTQDTIIPTRHTPDVIAGGTPNPRRNTPVPFGSHQPPPHYKIGELIGRGGMGEVIAAQDEHIGREVAIKRMRAANPDKEQLSRFLREARIQARLDHPAIVPVHELGTDPSGHPYFTMKRISGRTLAQHMHDKTRQQQLLRALVHVSRAVALAHSKGVIHRDLKPSNVMLGDYDEVYVLDWGVARVLDEDGDEGEAKIQDDISTLDDGTQTGTMLGTPGYMAPEMIKGEPAYRAADVYALGSILFEILTQAPLHPRGTAAIANTLHTPQEWPRRRTDKPIPYELDKLCFQALSEQPQDRPTAQRFADDLQNYLDGDRDTEARNKIAAEQLVKAHQALEKGGAQGRAEAILRAGRALALNSESVEAAQLVTELTIKPPDQLPPELSAELEDEERKLIKTRSRAAFIALLSLFSFWIFIPFLGIKNWGWLVLAYVAIAGHTAYVFRAWRTGKISIPLGLISALVFTTFVSRIGGLMIVTPILMCGLLIGFTSSSLFIRRRWIMPVWATAAFAIPIALEHFGVMPESWQITYDSIISHSSVFEMQGWYADGALIVCNVVLVIVVGAMAAKVHYAAKVSRRTLTIQNWHMNKLVPTERRPWNTSPGRDSMQSITSNSDG